VIADRSPENPIARPGSPTEDEIAQKRVAAALCKFAKLKEQTAEILDAVGAKRIVVVDDEAESIERYLEAYAAEPAELPRLAQEEFDVHRDNAAWRSSAVEVWEALTGEERRAILAHSREILDRINPTHVPTPLEALEMIFPEETFLLITPQEWEATQLALAVGESPPPILLFDQQLGSFGKTGLELLEAYRAARTESDPPAGILSNEVNDSGILTSLKPPDNERVPSGSLMLISKRHLSDGDYNKAVALFRLTANLPHLHDARDTVLCGLREDMASAIDAVRQLPPRVLDDLVYRSSRVEGAWEGETLARIAGLYLIRATRQREIGVDLKPIIDKARRLSCRVEPIEEIEDSSLAAAELHQIENFALAEWINGLKLPLASGDIFEVGQDNACTTETKHFVMVCQPCDLVVRGDGVREAREARLLPIVAKKKPVERLLEQPLPSSPPDPLPKEATVRLKKGFNVELAVLDLCSLNEDGTAAIADVDQPSNDMMLTEGMSLLREKLVVDAKSALDEIDKLKRRSLTFMRFGVTAQSSDDISLDYDPDQERRWRYPVRRIARLAPRHAEALLVRYSAAQARAAFDHALTKYSEGA
jgi:CheY-like chemotaxis protein